MKLAVRPSDKLSRLKNKRFIYLVIALKTLIVGVNGTAEAMDNNCDICCMTVGGCTGPFIKTGFSKDKPGPKLV